MGCHTSRPATGAQVEEAAPAAGAPAARASKYEDLASLNEAIRCGEEPSPMVFLRMAFLLDLRSRGERVPARQDLPNHAIYTGLVTDEVLLIALSYCWASRDHPDPELRVLRDLCAFLEYLDVMRHCGPEHIGDREVVVFWDYPSLFQNVKKEDGSVEGRTEVQERSFKAGLQFVNLIYAHNKVLSLFCTKAYRELGYKDSGWPYFEYSIAQLAKPTNLALDLPTALSFIEASRTIECVRDPLSKILRSLQFLQDFCAGAARELAVAPHMFQKYMDSKQVTNGADKAILVKKYQETFNDILVPSSSLGLTNLQVPVAVWESFMSSAYPFCNRLTRVDMSHNEALQVSLETFCHSAPLLQRLELANTSVHSASLHCLSSLKDLRCLDFSGCYAIRGDLQPLAVLYDLGELYLDSCVGLTGSVAPLAVLRKLRRAVVTQTRLDVDGAGVPTAEAKLSALWSAAFTGQNQITAALLQAKCDANRKHQDGTTPLSIAAQKDRLGVAELLLQHGGEVNLAAKNGATPLLVAAAHGHSGMAELLLQHGAEVDLAAKDGATPLFTAAEYGHSGVAEMLLQQGAEVNLVTKDGATPLLVASEYGHSGVAEMLLQQGAEVDLAAKDGATPLFTAAGYGHSGVAGLLLQQRADVNVAKKDGATPLFVAAQEGHSGVAELLLQHGAEVDLAKKDGATPLFIAARNGHSGVAELLLQQGAEVNLARNDGATPLYIARAKGHSGVAELLQQ